MSAQAKSINLLPPSEFEQSFWGRFLKWAVSAGRYIIILTELVVIMAFLSRFKLDRDMSIISSEIEGEKNVLETSFKMETEFRSIQKRLVAVNSLEKLQMGADDLIERVVSRFPSEAKMTSVYVNRSGIEIVGTTLTENSLGELLLRLSQDGKWKAVDLADVTADTTKGIKFAIKVTR